MAQIQARMWVRNGISMMAFLRVYRTSKLYYPVSLLRDLYLLQVLLVFFLLVCPNN